MPRAQWRGLRIEVLDKMCSTKANRGFAGTGRADGVETQAARADPQGQAATVAAGGAPVAVANDGQTEVDSAGVQQPEGGIYQHRHGDAERRLFPTDGGLFRGKPAAGGGALTVIQPERES